MGKSAFFFNYYGVRLLEAEGGLYNEVNVQERVLGEDNQVWRLVEADLLHGSGNTDSSFICTVQRDYSDPKSQI